MFFLFICVDVVFFFVLKLEAIEQLKGLLSVFENYIENEFKNVLNIKQNNLKKMWRMKL